MVEGSNLDETMPLASTVSLSFTTNFTSKVAFSIGSSQQGNA